jgi:FKBP-type peptidyl-prolyl cis-trans isomerase
MKQLMKSLTLAVVLAAFAVPAMADEAAAAKPAAAKPATDVVLETDAQKFGYAFGVQLGRQFRQAEQGLDFAAFQKGFEAAKADAPLALSNEELTGVMRTLTQKTREKAMAEQQRAVTVNLEKATAFLATNKAAEGVVTTESGLQYKVLEAGTADGAKPTAASTVKVHYQGTLLDGTEFDSSYKRNQPAEFPLNGVIKGWTEGLQHMPVGSKYRFWIHPDMAYGAQGRPSIPANSLLVFDVELLEIK